MNKKQIDSILYGIGCNSFNRFETFVRISPDCRGQNYWYALRIAYEGSDNIYHLRQLVKELFGTIEPEREKMMNTDEIQFLSKLPEKVTIYRGMTEKELKSKNFGISWTLKKEVAEFFAHTYQRNYATNHLKKVVHEMTINKNDIVAFLNDRKEFEVIYLT